MKYIIVIGGALLISFIVGLVGGFFLWLLWPGMVSTFLPGMVETGMIVRKITFWQGFGLSLFLSAFISGSGTNSKKE